MPAERRKRVNRHESAFRPEKRRFAVADNAVKPLELGSAAQSSGDEILAALSTPGQLKKKVKQHMRHEALLERLGTNSSPYSKSHMKRLKRKAKDELITDLAAVGEAIAAVDAQSASSHHLPQESDKEVGSAKLKPRPQQIGEGKAGSLTKNQRKRTFQAEKLRHTLIMADRDFSANPFSTIRTHAKNTLVEH